ncbi:MAG: malate/lactate/ureidoglycolate dehydrogenase [Alphaproteobacteria bacterium]|nr:malate/lactate/ureidoglycolate dehydrogenase [Alphaproteobacteria bacterium]
MSALESRFNADQLIAFSRRVLERLDVRDADAQRVAEHLVSANLAGHDSHGIGLLPAYTRHAQEGLVDLKAAIEVVRETSVIYQVDAKRSWGVCAADRVLSTLSEKALKEGLACGSIANAHHLGRIGAYAETLNARGLASLHFINVTDHAPLVAPFRGSDARFGTNPICIGFPGTDERPDFMLDIATSTIALGKVRVAAAKGVTVPPGTLLDPMGNPMTDPSGMAGFEIKGALTPFSRHKGYGLAYACELLAGLLSGGGTIQPENERSGGILNSMLSIVINPQMFGDTGWMAKEQEALANYVTQSPPMDWDSPVLVPGDPERAWRGKREREGIPLDEATLAGLNELASALKTPELEPLKGRSEN